MLQIIQNNLNSTPKTLPNLIWSKITHGIELNNKELEYLKKHEIKDIINFGLVENGCWIIDSWNDKSWYKYGKRHREDGPAYESLHGHKEYWVNGKLHKEDGPAIEWTNGTKEYYKNGLLHREDGPAKKWANGDKEYWVNGKLHKEDGPAIEYSNGSKEYWKDGNKLAINN